MGVKQRIKTIVPHRVWRVLQGCKANMTLASYYAGQRKRFLRFCAGQWNVGQSEQLRGTMVYYIHRIEKGLSHRRFRAGFGRSAFGELRSVMDEWRERDYPVDDVTYIAARQVVRASSIDNVGEDIIERSSSSSQDCSVSFTLFGYTTEETNIRNTNPNIKLLFFIIYFYKQK